MNSSETLRTAGETLTVCEKLQKNLLMTFND
jgi:hypothetical protein